jgi:hypothetical protein
VTTSRQAGCMRGTRCFGTSYQRIWNYSGSSGRLSAAKLEPARYPGRLNGVGRRSTSGRPLTESGVRMRLSFVCLAVPAVVVSVACSDDPTRPPTVQCNPLQMATYRTVSNSLASPRGVETVARNAQIVPPHVEVAGSPLVPLAPFQARTFRGAELGDTIKVPGAGANYLVVPQFATGTGERSEVQYTLGSSGGQVAAARVPGTSTTSPALHLDNVLRGIEGGLAPLAAREARALGSVALSRGPSLQQVGSSRTFRVLSCIPENQQQQLTFTTITATLRFAGQNILIYVDNQAPTGASGLSDSVLNKLGTWFDGDLYNLTVSTFGSESDVDGNDRVIVLMTPVVNGLTPRTNCDVVIAGFFFGLDLTQSANSNRGEVFYSLAPDPQGQFSCARSVRTVELSTPSTFVHEFQHMISFNQHVLVRGGPDEDTWLNEGLSHIAEEVAAIFYDNKYGPPPAPRLFTDTANIFIGNNLANSYQFLESTPTTSLTIFEATTGTLEERGAVWLFLRWLADQKDNTIFGRLVQTSSTGIANVENISAESFPVLFGDWALALWTDSIPNHPRTSVPERNRFKSRNLRQIFARLNAIAPSDFPRQYPLVLRPLPFGASVQDEMLPGTMEFFQFVAGSDPAAGLRFARPGGQMFSDALKPQLGVFRLP